MVLFQLLFSFMFWEGVLPEELFKSFTWLLLGGFFAANIGQDWIHQHYKEYEEE
jgi:hypothetical protein